MSTPGDGVLRIDVPADLSTLGAIRAAVSDAASGWGFPAIADLELVTSELVTNAVLHTGAPSVLTCHLLGASAVVVAVTDGATAPAEARAPYAASTRGRGLGIVDTVATSWGTFGAEVDGKTVWARLGR